MNKNQELEALYDTVRAIYQKNITFFSSCHPLIIKKIKYFEALNIENYFIEFINNHFELIDKQNNHIYNCDPFYDAKYRCKNINDKPSFNLIKTSTIEKGVFYKNSINAKDSINDFLNLEKSKQFKFNKFIFFGTLLGVHLNDLDKELNSFAYLIIEKNIEIFRLSMFLTDYESLAKNSKLFFCINENDKETKDILSNFLKYKYEFNNTIGFELSNESEISNIDIFTKYLIDFDPYNYPFSEYLISLQRSFFYKKNSLYGILNLSQTKNIFSKPILFLGAGHSLAKNIEWIYMNQDKFLIVCAAACLKRLELLDIIPDIILSIDGQHSQILKQFAVNDKYYKNSLTILSAKTDPEIFEILNKENTFFIQDNLEVFDNTGIFTGVTVGDIGLDLILRLGAIEIYMLGFDACISNTGKTHDGIYKSSKIKLETTNVIKNNGFNTSKNLIEVKGNFEDKVFTFILYQQMIESINNITKNYKTKIFNLSDGAYFENTVPLKITINEFDDKENLNKDCILNQLKNEFISLSKIEFTINDIKNIKQEQKIINKLENLKHENIEKEFSKLISSHKNSLALQIIEKFFNLIKPYNNYINTKESSELEFLQFKNLILSLKDSYNI